MYRGPAGRGRSKATPSTLCQKCLKRDIYECTVSAQERPYRARPSRTQQLLNPTLKPKLTTEVPDELLRKKGVADEVLAKKDEERGRKSDDSRASRRRSFSSSSRSDSVSTISTNRSPSRSPSPKYREHNGKAAARGGHGGARSGKRDRSESSGSVISQRGEERNTRRRLSSFSPARRGRSKRSASYGYDHSQDLRQDDSRVRSRSRARSRSKGHHRRRPLRDFSVSRSPSRSPMDTADLHSSRLMQQRSPRPMRSSPRRRSRSPGRGRRHRSPLSSSRSPSPYAQRRRMPHSPSPARSRDNELDGGRSPDGGGRGNRWDTRRPERVEPPAPPPQRERSLSPYSKRVALTRQVHGR